MSENIKTIALAIHVYFLLLSGTVHSQIIPQQVTVSAGGDGSGTAGSVAFSVGQVSYSAAETTAGHINEGVQQPYEIISSDGGPASGQAEWLVYPNPAIDQITIESTNGNKPFQWKLYDTAGNLVSSQDELIHSATIRLANLSVSVYHLQVITIENKTSNFTILKKEIR